MMLKMVLVVTLLLILAVPVFAQDTEYYVYRTEVLNIRNGPGTDHDIIGYLRYADPVEVIGEDGLWLHIRADILVNLTSGIRIETIAWAHSYYLADELPWLVSHQQTGGAYVCNCALTCESFQTFEAAMYQYLGCGCTNNVTTNINGYPVACDYKFDSTPYVPLIITRIK